MIPAEAARRPCLYCSPKCRWEAERAAYRPIERACAVCGKTFYCKPYDAARRPALYCSVRCKVKAIKPGPPRHGVEYNCERCGRPVYMAPSTARNPRRAARYCGDCWSKSKPRPPKSYMRTCEHCGREYTRTGHNQHSGLHYCSTECWYEAVRNNPELSPTYKGGYEPYYGPNWPRQRQLALERDRHRCQSCSRAETADEPLEVHHIKRMKDFAREWQEANRLANLVSLCKSCHARDGGEAFRFQMPLSI